MKFLLSENSFAQTQQTIIPTQHPSQSRRHHRHSKLVVSQYCAFSIMTVHHRLSVQPVFLCFSPAMAPRCVLCSPESVYSFQSLSLPSHPNPLLIFCASVKATHRCSSQLSTLLQVPISLFKSHSVISPEAPARLSSDHWRDTLTSSDVVQLQKNCLFKHYITLILP